jgi:hypothetical protein
MGENEGEEERHLGGSGWGWCSRCVM